MIALKSLVFDVSQIRAVAEKLDVSGVRTPTCDHYQSQFFQQSSDPINGEAAKWLMVVCGWRLTPESTQSPLTRAFSSGTCSTPGLEDVSDAQLAVVKDLLPDVVDVELRSRLADLLWLRSRDHRAARLAAEAYLGSAKRLIALNSVLGEKERLSRAMQLSAMVRKGTAEHSLFIEQIEEVAGRADSSNCTLASCLEVLLTGRVANFRRLSELASSRASQLGVASLSWALRFWQITAQLAARCDNPDLFRSAHLSAAGLFEEQARSLSSNAMAAHFWEQALHQYRRVPGTEAEQDRVHLELLEAQRGMPQEMIPMKFDPPKCSDLAEIYIRRIANVAKPLGISLFVFAPSIPTADQLRRDVRESFDKFPLQHLFSTDRFGSTWKKAAKAPGAFSGEEIPEDRMVAEMCQHSRFNATLMALGVIEPMRAKLTEDHTITQQDIAEFVHNSPLAPFGRHLLLTTGIVAGFEGRWIESLHVLVPQLEHSLRCVLRDQGVITSSIRQDGIQQEYNLNDLLIMQEARSFLGEDFAFCLRFVFTERHGLNLRNEIAHGMLSSQQFYTDAAAFAWWCLVHLFCSHHAGTIINVDGKATSTAESPPRVPG